MGDDEIKRYPDAVLRRVAKPVRKINRQMRDLLEDMARVMRRAGGVGLAAPQIGISRRVIVVDAGDGLIELVNPELVHGEGSETAVEGCLSVPGKVGEVTRYQKVVVSGLNRNGHRVWVEAEGLLARALQHEIDHLDGTLFLDRAQNVREVTPTPRVVLCATGEFAVPLLERLVEEGFEVAALVTRPDRPRGRGLRPAGPPIKEKAVELGIPVWQPPSLRTGDIGEQLAAAGPDFLVVADFGRILPPDMLAMPRVSAVNLHPSLLPRWRGPAPVERAIMAGDAVTGVTTLHMTDEVDAGDIILQREVPISPDDTGGTLREKLSRAGADLMVETLELLLRGEGVRQPQDAARATYAAELSSEDEFIDWNREAAAIVRQVRALQPRPGARTFWGQRQLKVGGARVYAASGPPGQVLALDSDGFVVGAGDAGVLILRVQPEGRAYMGAAEFLRGYRLEVGDRLGKEA